MEIEPFSLPLASPLGTATDRIESREGALIVVERDGVRGVGEATPLPGWTESLDACRAVLRAVAAGERPPASVDPAERPAARHGLTLAEADATARAAGVPLAQWLAADTADTAGSVPVNATIGDADPDATARAATAAVEAGFRCLKVKVGARPLGADLDRLRAIRREERDVTIRLDANGSWTRTVAEDALKEISDLNVTLIEQPLPPDDLDGHEQLQGRGVDIALDESLREHGIDAIKSADTADVVVLKPMVLGGLDRAAALARTARQHGMEPIVTTTIDGVVARTAALHLAASLGIDRACGLATADRLAEDLAGDPAPVRDGYMTVPDASGIGVALERP
ncbi:o-succinylbenzoate synthase [Halorhabdus sp. CBA1104]|uniref:mandelate racemase/muconate lactonizing enzyme family protein n=1 Tax=unclassified Halorhabdus TaxID=2621901 RepID=UPI0012B2DA2F|nr:MULTISPECIES: o-succinylbenzoate synthase [unclassified Halorhabdus]QGN06832.1 o-succinylbenzoate synthase [Halorhabdus sp. CBA1104]